MKMNLGDPEWELVDPTPDVYALFKNFDTTYFWSKLASRAVVRWSKRMYSCAGICSYEGRGGLCDIALSEPLLKLRPRKDLVETLLHEMIHAYLFVTCQDQDRDGHGPNFKSHMYRINKSAGLNISIYHDFHDEVKLYQTHWWRCNGPCQHHRPRFGIVRRTCNRAPGPSDYWWSSHQKLCGGKFIKIKEPENYGKKVAAKTNKSIADITKFITNRNDTINKATKPVLKDSNLGKLKANTKSTGPSTVVVRKNNVVINPQVTNPTKPGCSCKGDGHVLSNRKRSASVDVIEQVRNVWANKQLPLTLHAKGKSIVQGTANAPKNIQTAHPAEPKNKIMKIDNFFKTNATSVLKDVYGKDFIVTSSKEGKLIAEVKVPTTSKQVTGDQNENLKNTAKRTVNLVDCPICSAKIDSELINRHLDECLNKDVIEELSKESIPISKPVNDVINSNAKPVQNIWENVPKFDVNNKEIKLELPDSLNSSFVDELLDKSNKINQTPQEIQTEEHCPKIANNIGIKTKCVSLDIDYIEIPDKADFQANRIKTENDEEHISKAAVVCPCCGKKINVSIDLHLEECLTFFNNNNTVPSEGAVPSVLDTIVLDEDDEFDETLTLNASGTKAPCPCCLKMIEQNEMNEHLDLCLS